MNWTQDMPRETRPLTLHASSSSASRRTIVPHSADRTLELARETAQSGQRELLGLRSRGTHLAGEGRKPTVSLPWQQAGESSAPQERAPTGAGLEPRAHQSADGSEAKGLRLEEGSPRVATSTLDNRGLLMEVVGRHAVQRRAVATIPNIRPRDGCAS